MLNHCSADLETHSESANLRISITGAGGGRRRLGDADDQFGIRRARDEVELHGKPLAVAVRPGGPDFVPSALLMGLLFDHRVDTMGRAGGGGLPPVLPEIFHPYTDAPEDGIEVLAYDDVESFAEKFRALGERTRPRDLYDVVNLCRSAGISDVT